MAEEIAFKGEIKYLQVLDENGKLDKKSMPKISKANIKKLYELMKLTRAFDKKAFSLQRQGKIGTYAPVWGQEATQIGSAFALHKDDWLFPMYRDMGSYLVKGMPMEKLLQYWGWDERGQKIPDKINAFTMAIPVGTQALHAVGYSWGMKLKKKKAAVLVDFGDGATSTGDFHEAMNFAGVFKTPTVLLCENNQYAISVPVKKQTASETIAQKALAYGFEGRLVDGNDVFAVYKAVSESLSKARKGKGPTFIECYTYRVEHHTTSDDWTKYRSRKEVENWKKKDPIERLRKYMEKEKIWSKKKEKDLDKKIKKKIENAVEKHNKIKPQKIEDIFKYTYKELTPQLEEQLEYLKDFLETKKDEGNGDNNA